MLLARTALLLALPACTLFTGELEPCAVDDSTDVMLVFADQAGDVHDVVDGGNVPLVSAPQGGHILLVAPSLRMAGSCRIQINAALRDPVNGRVVGLEERPIELASQHGWARPADGSGLSDLANLAVCPTAASTTSIDGNPYRLEIKVLDENHQAISESAAMIVPSCDDAYCRSDCGLP